MKESEAWQILAEEHDAGLLASRFLCSNLTLTSIYGTKGTRSIPSGLRSKMVRRIERAIGSRAVPAYNYTVPVDEARAGRTLACLLFSEISKGGPNYVR